MSRTRASKCVARERARAIFSASLFTCPLFISPTRKPRAGLNTRANPIRCKCFRARPSPSLSRFSLALALPRPLSPHAFSLSRFFPVSLSLSSDFFVERLSLVVSSQISHTRGFHLRPRYARGLKLRVAEGCTTTSSRAEKESKVRRLKMSPLSHIIPFLLLLSLFLSLSLTLYPIISVAVLNLFIARLTLLRRILLTARAGPEQTGYYPNTFLNTPCIDGTLKNTRLSALSKFSSQ